MNLKSLMDNLGLKSLNAQPGQVIPNPYVRAFAPQPSVKEEVVNEEDHEVSMAQNSLDTIIKMATELKAKMGENEKDIPAWIQDHITNAENFISQASSNYHEYGTNESINEEEIKWNAVENAIINFLKMNTKILDKRVKDRDTDGVKGGLKSIISGLTNAQRSLKLESLNEEFKHIISVETPTQVVSKPIAAQIEKLARQGVRSKEIGLKMGFVGNQKAATDAFQKVKNKIYFELGKKNESVEEATTSSAPGEWVAYLSMTRGKKLLKTFDTARGAKQFLSKNVDKLLGAANVESVGIMTKKQWDVGEAKYAVESINESLTANDGKIVLNGKIVGYYDYDRGSASFWTTDLSDKQFRGSQSFDTKEEMLAFFKKYLSRAAKAIEYQRKALSKFGIKYPADESVNEARLTDIVNSIVETPVIGKMIRTEAKKYDIGSGWMGNGLTIWNRAEEEHGDYKIIAHISPDGKLSIRDKQLPSDIKKMFQMWADTMKKGDRPGIY